MTGPEHYQAGEQLIKAFGSRPGLLSHEAAMLCAQAHAALALAAAIALGSTGMDDLTRREWEAVAAPRSAAKQEA